MHSADVSGFPTIKSALESGTDTAGDSAAIAQLPSVSVIVPIRNEAKHIEACVRALLDQQNPPEHYEILVVDGMSDDGTREILARLTAEDARLRIIDNPQRITPTALNLGIRESVGEIVIRVDGHTTVAPDFVANNLALLQERPDAWMVGGPIAHRGRGIFGRGVAAAMSSAIGVGGAKHRFEHYEGYAEGAAFPAIRRWVFDRVGMFDEDLVRNQDDEFNFRMHLAGGKAYLSPRVQHDYFVRESPRLLWRQYFQYAFWKVRVMRKHQRPIALRHLVPMVFVIGAPALMLAAGLLSWPMGGVALAPLLLYSVLVFGFALTVTMRQWSLAVAACAAVAVVIMHVAYGVGTIYGMASRSTRAPTTMNQLSR